MTPEMGQQSLPNFQVLFSQQGRFGKWRKVPDCMGYVGGGALQISRKTWKVHYIELWVFRGTDPQVVRFCGVYFDAKWYFISRTLTIGPLYTPSDLAYFQRIFEV